LLAHHQVRSLKARPAWLVLGSVWR
jgi:hypothetical protein